MLKLVLLVYFLHWEGTGFMASKGFWKRVTGSAFTAAVAVSVACTPVMAASTSYTDVKAGQSHYDAIMALTEQGVVQGYDNGKFGQWDDVTRQQVAVMMYQAFDLKAPDKQETERILSGYDDVDSNHPYAKQIAAVTKSGIFKGNGGSFHPNKSITRQQVASVLLTARDLETYDAQEDKNIELSNVADSHKQRVQILANLGVTNQFDDFKPAESISRGAFATMYDTLDQKVKALGKKYELFDQKIIQEVNSENMYNDIDYLTDVPREAGTDGEKRAVDYIKNRFDELGYETEVQSFPVRDVHSEASVTIDGNKLDETLQVISGGQNGKETGGLVDVGRAEPGDIPDVEGKIALIERGAMPPFKQVMDVKNEGAVGAIMYDSEDGAPFQLVPGVQIMPAVGISRETGRDLAKQLEDGEIEVTLDVTMEQITKTSHNVIASLKPDMDKTTGQLVTIGAHHDSVPGGPGANDDASGVSAVLELARIYADKPIDTEVRFLTFGAEERGLVGSSYYMNSLLRNEKNRMVAHFQMDMIGARDSGADNPAGGLIMYTLDGNKNLVTDLGSAWGSETMDVAVPYGQMGRSDHQPFHQAGVPTALFTHAPAEASYHQPTDTLDKISKKKLQQVTETVGAAAYQIARPETPKLPNFDVADDLIDYSFDTRAFD
ncbi:M20/M25/M40 family metallo-hydrolase [Lentibacillus cibarius]|uniref:M20/M25/M40 family metallo-hydrolase n=2 Tax=Lentibacillus cibarius TaxID=2583219 RepID=A0A5S3QIQ0_9BACI|nr:M20/M25/M40 family metallo-hydrolase [Lentibacillus cibarius]